MLVRLDGGFAGPEMFEFLEAQRVDYVVAMAENAVLKRIAEPLMKKVRRMSKKAVRLSTSTGSVVMPRAAGTGSGELSSKPRWCAWVIVRPRTMLDSS